MEGVVTGSTASASDAAEGSCGGVGPDRVYTFTLYADSMVEFLASGYDIVLVLREVCDDYGSEVVHRNNLVML